MRAADRLGDDFPHGTVDGYRGGCRDANCPAPLACRDVYRRYSGDYSFRRLVDQGIPLEDILAREDEERAGIEQRDRAANRGTKARPAATKTATAAHTKTPAKATAKPKNATPPAPVVKLDPVAEWEQARDAWRAHRKALYADLRTAERSLAAATAERDRAQTAFDEFAAAGEPQKPKAADPRAGARERTQTEVRRLHASRLSDAEIAHDLSISVAYVGIIRRELHLPANVKRRKTATPQAPRPPRQVLGHGTNASYARGCRCDACKDAAREYHREWMANRRETTEMIAAEHHGTAYGYQLGCRSRKRCPATPSCADASLAEERRRRRAAGVPEAAPRVDAEPARAHVRALMAAGMTLEAVALHAGVPRNRLGELIYGRSDRGGEFPAQLKAQRAEQILAVKVVA